MNEKRIDAYHTTSKVSGKKPPPANLSIRALKGVSSSFHTTEYVNSTLMALSVLLMSTFETASNTKKMRTPDEKNDVEQAKQKTSE